jgi:hypothetical protein
MQVYLKRPRASALQGKSHAARKRLDRWRHSGAHSGTIVEERCGL